MRRPQDKKRGRRPYTMSEDQKIRQSTAAIIRIADNRKTKAAIEAKNG